MLLSEIHTAAALGYNSVAEWRRDLRAGKVPEPTLIRRKMPYWSTESLEQHLKSGHSERPTADDLRKRIAEAARL